MADVTRPAAVLGALERAAEEKERSAAQTGQSGDPEWFERYKATLRADAGALRELADALANQPIMWCSEREAPVTDWNEGTVRVCGWCAGCRLARLLGEGG